MGTQCTIYGYIVEANPGGPELESKIQAHNESKIIALPETDTWPPLPRSIFSWVKPNTPMVMYRNRPLHFAAILKEMDGELRDWLDKFEALLRLTLWESVTVNYEGAYIGTHLFEWWVEPDCSWLDEQGALAPTQHWNFRSSLDPAELDKLRAK